MSSGAEERLTCFKCIKNSSLKSSPLLVNGLILCSITLSDKLENTVVYIYAPLIFFLPAKTGDRESGKTEVEQQYACSWPCAAKALDFPLGIKPHNLFEWFCCPDDYFGITQYRYSFGDNPAVQLFLRNENKIWIWSLSKTRTPYLLPILNSTWAVIFNCCYSWDWVQKVQY